MYWISCNDKYSFKLKYEYGVSPNSFVCQITNFKMKRLFGVTITVYNITAMRKCKSNSAISVLSMNYLLHSYAKRMINTKYILTQMLFLKTMNCHWVFAFRIEILRPETHIHRNTNNNMSSVSDSIIIIIIFISIVFRFRAHSSWMKKIQNLFYLRNIHRSQIKFI